MIGILLLLAVTLALGYFVYKVKDAHKVWERRGVIHRPPKFLVGDFGDFFFRRDSIVGLFHKVYNAFPQSRYMGCYSFTFPMLVIRDLELIKLITVKDFDYFTDHRPFIPPEVDPVWGKGLLTLKGKRWRDMRATLSPAFTGSKMKQIFTLMDECAQNFVKYFQQHPDETNSIEAKDLLSRFANDVIATSAFGITVDSLKDKENEFYMMGKKLTDFSTISKNLAFVAYALAPKLAKLLDVQLFPRYLGQTFKEIVTTSIKEREEKSIKRPDMIDIMMEAKKGRLAYEESEPKDTDFAAVEESQSNKTHKDKAPITDDDIASQAVIFFFAGFDTISTVMSFMCYELAIQPDIQKKLQEEIDETLQRNNGKLSYETLSRMKYLDMVVSETLRKWPPTMAMDRLCTKPYTIQPTLPDEKPLQLNVGDFITIPMISIQMNPKYYPDPQRFDPERFNEENRAKIDPYTYMPFGIGPRVCIGSRFAIQEVKTLFVHLLSKFELEVTEKTHVPLQISKKSGTLQAEGGIWFRLKPRP